MAVTLRQVERVSATLGSGVGSVDVTLATTLLDSSKAFLVFGVNTDQAGPSHALVRGEIVSATTVRFTRASTTGACDVIGYVAEFTAGVTVERGLQTNVGSSADPEIVTLTSITDLSKAFVLVSYSNVGNDFNNDDWVTAQLFDDAGTKKLRMQIGGNLTGGGQNADHVAWQVVQYDDCAVQRGAITGMGSAVSSVTDSLSPAVALDKSFLNFTHRNAAGGSQSDIGTRMLRGRITSATQITIDRDNTGIEIEEIRWEVVAFTGSEKVQQTLSAFAAADNQNDETITAVSGLDKALALCPAYGRDGKTAKSNDDLPGEAWFTCDLTATGNLRLKRDPAADSATADAVAYVIDFGAGAVEGSVSLGATLQGQAAGTADLSATAPLAFDLASDMRGGAVVQATLGLASQLGVSAGAAAEFVVRLDLQAQLESDSSVLAELSGQVEVSLGQGLVTAGAAELVAAIAAGLGQDLVSQISLAIDAVVPLDLNLGASGSASARVRAASALGLRAGTGLLAEALLEAGLGLDSVEVIEAGVDSLTLQARAGRTKTVSLRFRSLTARGDRARQGGDAGARSGSAGDGGRRRSEGPRGRTKTIT